MGTGRDGRGGHRGTYVEVADCLLADLQIHPNLGAVSLPLDVTSRPSSPRRAHAALPSSAARRTVLFRRRALEQRVNIVLAVVKLPGVDEGSDREGGDGEAGDEGRVVDGGVG